MLARSSVASLVRRRRPGHHAALFVLCAALTACSSDPDGGARAPLTVKLINTNAIAVVGFYAVPAGRLPESGWTTADWGANLLPLPRLEKLQYVRLADFPRQDLDCVAAFDPAAAVEPLRWNVPANWIPDAELLTVSVGRSGPDDYASGHAFGVEDYPGEVDVTPR